MKRVFTLFTLLIISSRLIAQSYSLGEDTTFIGDDISNIVPGAPVVGIVNLTITSSTPKTTKWERSNGVLPAGWTNSVCDFAGCYDASISNRYFTVNSTTNGQITLDFYPTSAGYAVTNVHLSDSLNSSDQATATFVASVSDINSVRKVFRVKDIYLSPVPAKENLSVVYDEALHPSKVEIYNVLGQLMKTVKIINDGTSKVDISLSGLEKGLYFLRLYSADNKVLTRQFSKD